MRMAWYVGFGPADVAEVLDCFLRFELYILLALKPRFQLLVLSSAQTFVEIRNGLGVILVVPGLLIP